jgi:hypothetical protein
VEPGQRPETASKPGAYGGLSARGWLDGTAAAVKPRPIVPGRQTAARIGVSPV